MFAMFGRYVDIDVDVGARDRDGDGIYFHTYRYVLIGRRSLIKFKIQKYDISGELYKIYTSTTNRQ